MVVYKYHLVWFSEHLLVIEGGNIPEESGGDKFNTEQNVTKITKTTHNEYSNVTHNPYLELGGITTEYYEEFEKLSK